MTGYEFLKSKREEKQMTVRGLAAACDIAPRTVSYYENGKKLIPSIATLSFIRLSEMLGISIEEYFDEFYPYKKLMDEAIDDWNAKNPKCLQVSLLKKRIYQSLMKSKERKSIPAMEMENLLEEYRYIFSVVFAGKIVISEEEYNRYVLDLNYKKQISMHSFNVPEGKIAQIVKDAYYRTDYKFNDFSKLCGVTNQHLRGCLDGTYDIEMLHISNALKICYFLGISFQDTFQKNISF